MVRNARPSLPVDRVICVGEAYEMDLFFDIACEVYQLKLNEKFTMTLTSTLNLDGTPDSDEYSPDHKVSPRGH